ncbi:MAG: sigma-54-dependent Fis family transcriptional regulator [Deltaproteobacteria bacterium]|nr:sigma-54-dependent Fis family transcriptional regulator [Deltaproteobacteria bacterium]
MADQIKLLVVDDEQPLRELLRSELVRSGYVVQAAADGAEGLALFREEIFNVVLLDIRMPGSDGLQVLRQMRAESTVPEIIMLTGHGTIESAVECLKQGASDYLTKPVKLDELELAIRKANEKHRLHVENMSLKLEVKKFENNQVVGKSAAIRKVLQLVSRIGATGEHVLVHGESGTGKELVARAVHDASPRAGQNFIAVNCGRLNVHTSESELFGHTQGAYTGASKSRAGVFELANGGTIFMDEISEMPLDVQVKLLRILETQTFRRLGGNHDITVDVRFVFASNKDLALCSERGTFREDLYHRISLLPIALPPLRERREDIPLLTQFFLETDPHRTAGDWSVTPAAMSALCSHHWPGNVRELKNALRRACILAPDPRITPDLLPFVPPAAGCLAPAQAANGPLLPLWEVEKDHILRVLAATGRNKSRAAEVLEIDRKTLYAKIERYQLPH